MNEAPHVTNTQVFGYNQEMIGLDEWVYTSSVILIAWWESEISLTWEAISMWSCCTFLHKNTRLVYKENKIATKKIYEKALTPYDLQTWAVSYSKNISDLYRYNNDGDSARPPDWSVTPFLQFLYETRSWWMSLAWNFCRQGMCMYHNGLNLYIYHDFHMLKIGISFSKITNETTIIC